MLARPAGLPPPVARGTCHTWAGNAVLEGPGTWARNRPQGTSRTSASARAACSGPAVIGRAARGRRARRGSAERGAAQQRRGTPGRAFAPPGKRGPTRSKRAGGGRGSAGSCASPPPALFAVLFFTTAGWTVERLHVGVLQHGSPAAIAGSQQATIRAARALAWPARWAGRRRGLQDQAGGFLLMVMARFLRGPVAGGCGGYAPEEAPLLAVGLVKSCTGLGR